LKEDSPSKKKGAKKSLVQSTRERKLMVPPTIPESSSQINSAAVQSTLRKKKKLFQRTVQRRIIRGNSYFSSTIVTIQLETQSPKKEFQKKSNGVKTNVAQEGPADDQKAQNLRCLKTLTQAGASFHSVQANADIL
jgi:hypothetical protein